jgi:hypothetical protein
MARRTVIILACALIFSVAATNVPCQSLAARNPSSSEPEARSEKNAKVRADIAKLVADAKAGKVSPRKSQFPPPQSNGLSKGAKIAIVAGIVVVILAIIIVHEIKNIHCESRCVL